MTKTTSIFWVAAALAMSAVPAAAQTTKNIFVDVNLGVQVASRTFVVTAEPIVYNETAILSTSQKVGSGVVFDLGGGYRVWRDLSIGLGYSYADGSANAEMTAAVPDPLFHDRRVETTSTVESVKHSENAFHIQAVWTMPVTDKMDAAFSFGPSFIHVSQDVVNNITVEPGTQNATAAPETHSDTASGFQIGADLSYLLNPRYGIGGFIRYVGGSVDLPGVENLKLGGFQIGGGARFRF